MINECKECVFFWKEEDEIRPSCHFESRGWFDIPPCEEDDPEEPEDYSEYEEYEE